MRWYTEQDGYENTIYLASSSWHDDGICFTYRLKPILRKNKIRWVEDHDPELRGWPYPRIFPDIKSAKKYVRKLESDSLKRESVYFEFRRNELKVKHRPGCGVE